MNDKCLKNFCTYQSTHFQLVDKVLFDWGQNIQSITTKSKLFAYKELSTLNNWVWIGFTCFAGYYAGGRRLSGIVSHFILGVAVKENGQTVPTEFRSFCRVGSGYSNKDLFSLLQKLQPHFRKGGVPSHLKFGREKPDVWIDPKKSVVVQIKAAEIVASDGFDVGCTLRYPGSEICI